MSYGIIYKVTNVVNGKVYIGQTTIDLEARRYIHINRASKHNLQTVLSNAIRKYGEDSFSWEIIDVAESRESLNNKEMYWINHYKSYIGLNNSNGYNMTIGGEGSTGYKQSDEVILNKSGENSVSAKMSKYKIKEMLDVAKSGDFSSDDLSNMYSIHTSSVLGILSKRTYKKELSEIISDDELAKIRDIVLKVGEKNRRREISVGNRGKKISKESLKKRSETFKNNKHGKPVLQIDIKTRNIVARYDSVRDGAKSTGFLEYSISQCCRNEIQYSNGYIWVFEDEYDEKDVKSRKIVTTNKSVLQIDLKSGKAIEKFNSIAEGAKAVKGDSSAISKCCRGKMKKHRGFGWKYEGDNNVRLKEN